jgi:glycosyltransferase involved in cell wall biosynthesis
MNRMFAWRLARRWRGRRVLVISVVNAPLAAYLSSYLPVFNITDATFTLMRNFYANFARLASREAAVAEELERLSIIRAVHNSFSSDWAARSAVEDYGASPSKVTPISWGINLDDVPTEEVRGADSHRVECRLLFIGVDWVRKGGDVVCAAAEILASRGFDFQVDLVGSAPPGELVKAPWIRCHGFLSKADEAELGQLRELIRNADFLFLPTRQDCTPMVFGEANAYGTPAVTRAVGGVAHVVRHGVNGIVLPESAEAVEFASAIETAWRDKSGYAAMRESARREYEERLNWDSWATSILKIIHDLQATPRV